MTEQTEKEKFDEEAFNTSIEELNQTFDKMVAALVSGSTNKAKMLGGLLKATMKDDWNI